MPKRRKGGIEKWCPNCKEWRVSSASNPTTQGQRSGQRWLKTTHPDIRWFRRALTCKVCYHQWLTAEVQEDFLEELGKLRDSLADVKTHAEQYMKQSDKASASLKQLNESLEILRALDMYKDAKK